MSGLYVGMVYTRGGGGKAGNHPGGVIGPETFAYRIRSIKKERTADFVLVFFLGGMISQISNQFFMNEMLLTINVQLLRYLCVLNPGNS